MPLPIIITNSRGYKTKTGPLAFLYDISAVTVYDVLLLTSSVSVITDELKLELCLVNWVFSMNLLLLCYTNLVSSVAQERVVVLIHKTETKTTCVKVVNAFDNVLGENTCEGRVLLHAFLAVFHAPLAFILI
jgi:hypothetical protein